MSTRPPLTAIFVFCTAARHQSFKLAAEELCVTPGAVSRQIHTLESYLGHALFERAPRAVRLTRDGEVLRQRVSDKVLSIGAEVESLRAGVRKTVIRVDAGVTVAMHWLIPRLARFSEANPDTEVQINTSDGPVDLAKRMDVHIRREVSEFRGLDAHWFLTEQSILVASPKFDVAGASGIPDRIRRCTRIGARSRPDLWPQWADFHRLQANEFGPTLELDNTVLAIQAVVQGLGVMFVPMIFVSEMLAMRLLIPLDSTPVPTGDYSYAVRGQKESDAVKRFAAWLRCG